MKNERAIRHTSRGVKGIVFVTISMSISLLLTAWILIGNIRTNKENELNAARQTMEKMGGKLLSAMDQTGGIAFSLEKDAFVTVPYFTSASKEQIQSELIDASKLPVTALGNPNPFAEGSTMFLLASRLKILNQANPFFDAVALYAPKSDCYLLNAMQGMYNAVCFGSEEIRKYIIISGDQLDRLLRENSIAFGRTNQSVEVNDSLAFSQKLSNGTVVIFVLSYNRYKDALLDFDYGHILDAQGFALFDDDDNTLYWTSQRNWFVKPNEFFNLGNIDWQEMSDIVEMKLEGKPYVVMQVKIPRYDMRYVAVFEYKQAYLTNNYVTIQFLIMAGLWFLTLLGSSLYLFKHWYKLIKSISKQLPSALSANPTKDEYENVYNGIMQLLENADNANVIITEQENLLLSASLLQLLRGDSDISRFDETTRKKLDAICQRYMIFVLWPGENAHWSSVAGNEQEYAYFDSAVPLTVQDMLNKEISCYTVMFIRHENQLILFISDPRLDKDVAEKTVYESVKELRSKLSIDILVYQSDLISGHGSARSAYQSALARLPYSFDAQKDDKQVRIGTGLDQLHMELRMVNMIYIEDYSRAYLLFEKIVHDIFEQRRVPSLLATQIAGLIGRTYSILIESNTKNKEILDKTLLLAHSINLVDEDQLLALWRSAFLFLRKPSMNTEEYSYQFKAIHQYLLDHYRDANMSLALLANEFTMSMPTISREFQKNIGMGFLDCLHRMRIDAAKKDLRETRKSVKDIAESVGYTNILTMTRAFKKYVGTTPGAFRKDDYDHDDEYTDTQEE